MDLYQRVSKYKSQLMGIAIMIVVYGHMLYYHSGLRNYAELHWSIWYTLGSVEMFIFISGFGIYHSLKKNSDAYGFYSRRLSRLVPSFLPVMIGWCLFSMLFNGMLPTEAIGNLAALGWWFNTGNQFNWYVPAVLILYLLSPIFYHAIEKYGRKSIWVYFALLVVVLAGFHSVYLVALTRFPTYFLGMYMGYEFDEKRSPRKASIAIWSIIGIAWMAVVPYLFLNHRWALWHYGLYWLPFCFSITLWLDVISLLLHFQSRFAIGRFINKIWDFLGVRSFEIYLCHLAIYSVCLRVGFHSWPAWMCIAVLGTCAGCIYHEIVTFAVKKWKARSTV